MGLLFSPGCGPSLRASKGTFHSSSYGTQNPLRQPTWKSPASAGEQCFGSKQRNAPLKVGVRQPDQRPVVMHRMTLLCGP
uniref:Uncharacterized protein n=1 Tax=Knipowitschia caucasica TaxID=637954 RepID=A0AAV2KIS9_KNICA